MAISGSAETELKLELTREAAERLEASGLLPGNAQIIRQHAIYFDTPDQALAELGLSLRIRLNGDKRVQTVKASSAASGLFVRSEWERDVEDDIPIIDDATPIPTLIRKKASGIAPLFAVENERRLWTVEGIEIALDRGRILAGERETSFCEIELEHKRGDPYALFGLAQSINKIVPVRLGTLSKAERGYRLLGPLTTTASAEPIRLPRDISTAGAFQAIVLACLSHFQLNLASILERREPAALHQARVALRRLRSALSIHSPMLTDGRLERPNDELRWLAGELGEARDLDVLIERAEEGPLRDKLGDVRKKAYLGAVSALQSDRARAVMIDIVGWTMLGAWLRQPDNRDIRDLSAREFSAGRLDCYRRKVKRSGRNLEGLGDEARHEVRKAAKKLRYAAEFFCALYDGKHEERRQKRFVAAVEALQSQLGAVNDLASTSRLLRELGLSNDPAIGDPRGRPSKREILKEAAGAYDDLIGAKCFWR